MREWDSTLLVVDIINTYKFYLQFQVVDSTITYLYMFHQFSVPIANVKLMVGKHGRLGISARYLPRMVNMVNWYHSSLITTKGNLRSGQFAWNCWKVSHTQLHFGDGFSQCHYHSSKCIIFDSFFGCRLKIGSDPEKISPCLYLYILCLLKRLMRIYISQPPSPFFALQLLLSSFVSAELPV